jgi:hypothetical protein
MSIEFFLVWMAAGPPEHADLATESGVFRPRILVGNAGRIGNDQERLNPVPRQGKSGTETSDSAAEQCVDGSHGQSGPRSLQPVLGHRDASNLTESLASMNGVLHEGDPIPHNLIVAAIH